MARAVLVVDDERLRYRLGAARGPLDVVFDGHRVWSIDPSAHPEDADGLRTVTWPAPLAERLDGVATVELREHGGGLVLAGATCSFGSGVGAVDLTDDYGRPLSLSKWGRLNQSFADIDPHTLSWYLDRTSDVLAVLAEAGRPAFLAYGTLLGAVRSGRLIGHDMDVDLAYLSGATTPVDAMRESFELERALRARGWPLRRQNGGFLQVFFHQPLGGWRNVDIFTMFVDPAYPRLYGINDTTISAGREVILPLGRIELEGRRFPAPRRPEDLLAAAYGPSWRVPDPSFEYGMNPGKRQMRHWFGGFREDHDRWSRLYRQQPQIVRGLPTEFASWVMPRLSDIDAIIDAGCGMGRDTRYYASSVPAAVGLDAAGSGVRRAQRRAGRRGSSAEFRMVNFGVLRETLACGALLVRDLPGRRAVVARHLLDAMGPAALENFLGFCSMACGKGGQAAFQFCTEVTATEFVEFPGMPKWGLSSDTVADRLRSWGAEVDAVEHLDGPEGATCRMTAMWA